MPHPMDETMPTFDGGTCGNGVQQIPPYFFQTGSGSDSAALGGTLGDERRDMQSCVKGKIIFAKGDIYIYFQIWILKNISTTSVVIITIFRIRQIVNNFMRNYLQVKILYRNFTV